MSILLSSLFYRRRNKEVKRFCYLTKITHYRGVKPESASIDTQSRPLPLSYWAHGTPSVSGICLSFIPSFLAHDEEVQEL